MREYLTVFLVSLAVTYLLAVFAREIAMRLGAVAKVRDRDVHEVPVPYFGGIAMYGGMVASYLVARELPFLSNSGGTVFRDAGVVLAAGGLICALGVVDDWLELDALTKLGGQVLASGVLVVFGVQLYHLVLPGGGQYSLGSAQSALATVVLVVATVNAVNFVDGLDGLAAGIVGIGAAAFFVFSYYLADANGETLAITSALLCAGLGGACAGFLPHNLYPARMFMGDSGSMLLGLVLASSALTLTGQFPTIDVAGAGTSSFGAVLPILLPISIMVVPYADLVLAMGRRALAGRSLFAPDKQHLHHQLLQFGHSHRRAVLVMWLWAALLAFGGVLASLFPDRRTLVILAGWLVLTVAATFVVPRVQRPGAGHHEAA